MKRRIIRIAAPGQDLAASLAEERRPGSRSKPRYIDGVSKPRLHVSIAAEPIVRPRLGEALAGFRLVRDDENADVLLLTPEDLEDIIDNALAVTAYDRTRDQESVPATVVDRLLAGESPVKVWREYRGLTLAALAEKAELGKSYLSQIENRRRSGTVWTMKKIATVLQVDLDDLTDQPGIEVAAGEAP
jgi:DNA-binding XRE family transcriptional regulator